MSNNKKILVVEDEHTLRAALHSKFENEGYEILDAKDGEEGLAVALEQHPDIILLDVIMPKMDGIEMAKRLRADAWGKTVPILILSNAPDMSKVQEAMENGIFEYFIKSDTKIEHIVEKVESLLS